MCCVSAEEKPLLPGIVGADAHEPVCEHAVGLPVDEDASGNQSRGRGRLDGDHVAITDGRTPCFPPMRGSARRNLVPAGRC